MHISILTVSTKCNQKSHLNNTFLEISQTYYESTEKSSKYCCIFSECNNKRKYFMILNPYERNCFIANRHFNECKLSIIFGES